MYLQIADALAACFSHSAKNRHCNEWPQAFRDTVAAFNAGAVSASVPAMTNTMIYHMCKKTEWDDAQPSGSYPGSENDKKDKFIHFSTVSQVERSAWKHRNGQHGLVLLRVPTDRVTADLKWEPPTSSDDGDERFPHLYKPLRVDAVAEVYPLPLGPDGKHIFPPIIQGSPE
jgi:uncharacterized protein (DUF952 family)